MNKILQVLSGIVLLLFAAIWSWIGYSLLQFQPTAQVPTLDLAEAQVTVAGFLASAVGAGTASVLGIEIQKAGGQRDANSGLRTVGTQVNEAAKASILLTVGILLYAVVGVFVLLVWLFNSNESQDMIGAFAFGVLGWLAGAFAAVFRKAT